MRTVLLFVAGILSAADSEYALVDKLIKADRAVEVAHAKHDRAAIAKANAQSEAAGKKLTDYCASVKKTVGIKRSGMIGCLPEDIPWPEPKK